jgi:hypothetical protein
MNFKNMNLTSDLVKITTLLAQIHFLIARFYGWYLLYLIHAKIVEVLTKTLQTIEITEIQFFSLIFIFYLISKKNTSVCRPQLPDGFFFQPIETGSRFWGLFHR